MNATLLEKFEAEWSSCTPPRIEDYLAKLAPQETNQAIRALLDVEIRCRLRRGETPRVDEYALRFPEFADVIYEVAQLPTSSPVELATTSFHASAAEAPAIRAGQKLGGFSLRNLLGQGGFGVVYQAYDKQLDRDVAIKLPKTELNDETQLRRFIHEARAAAQLVHPNIVRVLDAGQIGLQHFMASELIRGESLRRWMRRHPRVAVAKAAEMVAVLANALHYAHSKGIVHRDVKPENVLINETEVLFLTDFGLAHRGDELLTQDGAVIGTPAYMSPEQVTGKSHEADPRTDVWALGVLLYELLSGERPFSGSGTELFLAIVEKEPADLRQHVRKLPRDLATICGRCLAKDRSQRFATAGELADDLQRWLAGEPIHSRRVGLIERAWQWSRRNPALAITASVATLAMVLALSASISFAAYRQWAGQSLASASKQVSTSHAKAAKAEERADIESERKTQKQVEASVDRALSLCKQGDICQGLLLLAQSLELGDQLPSNKLEVVTRLNLATWSEQMPVLRHQLQVGDRLTSSVLTPDGVTLVIRIGDQLEQLDLVSGRSLGPPATLGQKIQAFHPISGERVLVAFAGTGSQRLQIWDFASRKLTDLGLDLGVTSVKDTAMSLEAKRVVTLDGNGKLHLFAIGQAQELPQTFSTQVKVVYRMELHPNGTDLLTQDAESVVRGWNLKDGTPNDIGFRLKRPGLTSVKFDRGSAFMLVATGDQPATVIDHRAQKIIFQTVERRDPTTDISAAFDHSGKLFAIADRVFVRLYEVRNGQTAPGQVLRHAADVGEIGIDPGGRLLYSRDSGGIVRVWNLPILASPQTFHHPQFIWDLVFDPKGEVLAVAGGRGFSLFQLTSSKGSYFEHEPNMNSIRFSGSGKRLTMNAVGGDLSWESNGVKRTDQFLPPAEFGLIRYTRDDRFLVRGLFPKGFVHPTPFEVWDLATETKIAALDAQEYHVNAMLLSPDDQFLVLGCSDGRVRFLTVANLRQKSEIDCGGEVTALTYNGGGDRLASGTRTGQIQVWDASNLRQLSQWGASDAVAELHLSADGTTLLARTVGNSAIVFDVTAGQRLEPDLAHHQILVASALSTNGKWCATASADGSAQLWHAHSCRSVGAQHRSGNRIVTVTFSPDSKKWCWGDRDGLVNVIELPQVVSGNSRELIECLEVATGQQMLPDRAIESMSLDTWLTSRLESPAKKWSLQGLKATAQQEIVPVPIQVELSPPTVAGPTIDTSLIAQAIKDLGGAVFIQEGAILEISFFRSKADPDSKLLQQIGKLATLRSLHLGNLQPTDDDLLLLQNCGRLHILLMDGTRITDSGLKTISVLRDLKELSIRGAAITDQGLAELTGLGQLERLLLTGCPISDAGMIHLEKLEKLKELYVGNTKLTYNAISQLQSKRPSLQIIHNTRR